MILDSEELYSDSQALVASAASSNKIDHKKPKWDLGEPMGVLVTVKVAAKDSDGNETYKVKLQTDDNEAFGTATDIGQEVTIPRGAAAGTQYVIPVPPTKLSEQYSRCYFTLGGTNPTLTVQAELVPLKALQSDVIYPKGYSIS